MRHKLVQRIVAAYDEHSARQAPELRPADTPPPAGVSPLEVDVLGDALPAEQVRRACVLAAATAGVEDGHVAVAFVAPEEIAALNAEHRGKHGPDRRALVPGRRRRAGAPASASWATS